MRLTQLDGLLAFVTVAKHRGFTAAGQELELSPAALSQAVRALEERMGVRLFNRTTRSVSLTEAGAAYLERVGPAVADLLDASESLAHFRDRPSGLLRLNTSRVVAASLLRGLLPDFLAAHPEIEVEMHIDDGFTDIVAEGFDAGFRLGDSVEKDMVAVPFGPPMQVAVVGSPAYFARRKAPATLADLREHDCIRFRIASSGQFFRWEFVEHGQPVEHSVRGPFACNDSLMMMEAALDGLGLAYTFDMAVSEHVAAGRLVRVLQVYCPSYPGIYIYYPGRRQLPPKLRRFIDFGTARLRPNPRAES